MQRPLRHDPQLGDYLEVTPDDISIANELARKAFANSLADLSQPGRQLLGLIEQFMEHKAASAAADKDTFSRRELREAIHWRDTRLRVHLRELVELEHVAALSGRFGVAYHYRLLDHGCDETGRFLAGLKSVERLRYEARLAGIGPDLAYASPVTKGEVAASLGHPGTTACQEPGGASQTLAGEPVPAPPITRVDQ